MKKELGKSHKYNSRYREKRVLIKIGLCLWTVRDREKMTITFFKAYYMRNSMKKDLEWFHKYQERYGHFKILKIWVGDNRYLRNRKSDHKTAARFGISDPDLP